MISAQKGNLRKGEGRKMETVEGIEWLGHASFRIRLAGKVIYIDPWKIAGGPPADWILITHSHFDHFSVEDVKKVAKADTLILATPDCQGLPGKVHFVKPGDTISEGEITVRAVPAYNLDKDFHPRKNQWVGYVISGGGRTIYHAGDSDAIPEMKALAGIDIALLPVSGVYVMTAQQAAEIANAFQPSTVIPHHWGDIVGSEDDARLFASLFKGKTILLKKTT